VCRYLTAGFLEKDDTIPLLLALEAGGADVSFYLLASAYLSSHDYSTNVSPGAF
jgi:hypothetical protein